MEAFNRWSEAQTSGAIHDPAWREAWREERRAHLEQRALEQRDPEARLAKTMARIAERDAARGSPT
jgi:hypothetical protein